MNTKAIQSIITRLEAGEGPSRSLDAEIAMIVIKRNHPDAEWIFEDCIQAEPGLTITGHIDYTSSHDAASELVPDGFLLQTEERPNGTYTAAVFVKGHPHIAYLSRTDCAMPCAITAAALKAVLYLEEQDG